LLYVFIIVQAIWEQAAACDW